MSKNLIIGIVAAIILAGGALFILNKPGSINPLSIFQNQQPSSTTPTSQTTDSSKPSTTKTTVAKPVTTVSILGIQMSANLAVSGAALKPSSVFSSTTPTLYAVVSLKNATQRTQISYIRYYGGQYVDSKVSHPSIDGAKYFHFAWALNAGQTRKVGNYSLVFYVNGKKAQTVHYSIQ